MARSRAVILLGGMVIVVAVGLFYGSRFRHRRAPVAKAGIVKVNHDSNAIVAVDKVEASAMLRIGDDAQSTPKNDQVEFKLPKVVIDDMGLNSKPDWVRYVTIHGAIINSSDGGYVVWDCAGLTDYHSEVPVGGKTVQTGWKITVDQTGTSRTPDVWHSNPQIKVINLASGDMYRVVADCDIQVKDFGPMDVSPTGGTVRWHAPVRIGSAPADAEHHSP